MKTEADPSSDGWRTLAAQFVVPEEVGETKVNHVQIGVIIEGMHADDRLFLDDVGFYRVGG